MGVFRFYGVLSCAGRASQTCKARVAEVQTSRYVQQYLSPGGQRGYNRRDTFQQAPLPKSRLATTAWSTLRHSLEVRRTETPSSSAIFPLASALQSASWLRSAEHLSRD